MIKKKAKGKGKSKSKGKKKAAKKQTAKKSTGGKKKAVDMVRVRENINNLVGSSAKAIATKVIEVAKTGQLASAKYLFEAVGLYPATEETKAKPPEDSLAFTLLRRMGLPTEPVICDDEVLPSPVASDFRGMTSKARDMAKEDREGEGDEEQEADAVERDE
jgi:hypothetical protein